MAASDNQVTGTLRLKHARAGDGLRWMWSGVRLVGAHPLSCLAMASLMLFLLGTLMALPWVGVTLVFMLLPALNVGWVAATSTAAAGRTPPPWMLFIALRSTRRAALLRLGLLYGVLALVLMNVGDLIDPDYHDQSNALLMASQSGEAEAGAGLVAAVQQGTLLRLALLAPLVLAFWHAPIIVMQANAGLGKALFGSVLATWRNLGAFAVYGVSWLVAEVVVSTVLVTLLATLGLGGASMVLAMPIALAYLAAIFGSLRATMAGCIEFDGAPPTPEQTPAAAD